VKDLNPRGAMQKEIVDDIVQIRWKLRRLPRIEHRMMANEQDALQKEHKWQRLNQRSLPEEPLEDHPIEILAASDYSETEYARLELYRQRLHRQMHTLLRELRQLRK